MQVNEIVQTQEKMREYLEKVHRRYITERLHHKSEQRVITLSKYPSAIHVYLRDVHTAPPYLDNNFSCVKTCEETVEIVFTCGEMHT